MAQVSRLFLSKNLYERIFEIFFKSILKLKNKKEAEEFFNDLLTPTERIVLAKRLAIAMLLAKDYDYRTIRSILHVSPPTIAHVKNTLKRSGTGYRKTIGRLMREEKTKELLLEILGDFAGLGSLGGSEIWRGVRKGIQKSKRRKVI